MQSLHPDTTQQQQATDEEVAKKNIFAGRRGDELLSLDYHKCLLRYRGTSKHPTWVKVGESTGAKMKHVKTYHEPQYNAIATLIKETPVQDVLSAIDRFISGANPAAPMMDRFFGRDNGDFSAEAAEQVVPHIHADRAIKCLQPFPLLVQDEKRAVLWAHSDGQHVLCGASSVG
jgi:hypothetical protein